MPIYTWEDEVTGKSIEILRSHDEYQTPPTAEEASAAGIQGTPVWKKILGKGIKVIKGASWGRGKGSW